jgi:hypothetical protein
MGKQPKTRTQLATHSQLALVLSQHDFGKLIGSSRRTVQRWAARQGEPTTVQLALLARHVYPRDPKLAAELAEGAGGTLESLGIVEPPAPPPSPRPPQAPPSPPPAPAAAPRSAPEQLVENILYAAAAAMDMSPRVILPAVRAAFARARQLDIDVAAIDTVLTPPLATSSERRKSEPATRRTAK